MSIFNEIKERVSALDAARYYGLNPKQTGRNAVCRCCFHSDANPSMVIYPNAFHCFACGAHVDITGLVAKIFSLSNYAAAKKIIEDFHLNINVSGKIIKNNFNSKTSASLDKGFTDSEIEYGLKLWRTNALDKYAKMYRTVRNKLEKDRKEKWKRLEDLKPEDAELFWTLVAVHTELDLLTDILVYGDNNDICALYKKLKNEEEF